MIVKEFIVNAYITLRLENKETVIYIAGERFRSCKAVSLNIPISKTTHLNDIESIDELVDKLKNFNVNLNETELSPEDEFWGHCSSLQIWAENEYNTDLLHSSLAFPLLVKLSLLGDLLAKKLFKKEVVRRLSSGFFPTIYKLIEAGYTSKFELYDYEISFKNMRKKLRREDLKKIIEIEAEQSAGGGYLGNYEALQIKYSLDSEKLKLIKEIESHIGRFIPYCSDTSIKGPFMYIENNKIKILALDNLDLSYIPEFIGNLKEIESLRLGNNKLKTINKSIGNLENLLSLSLQGNLLTTLPESIKNLKELNILLLSDNKFSAFPLNSLFLKKLEYLTLSNNNLSQIPKDIEKLKILKHLNLDNNTFSEFPSAIFFLKQIEELSYCGNNLSNIPKSILKLQKLRILELRKNNLRNIPEFISDLSSLTELHLKGNPLKEVPESILRKTRY